MADKKTKKRRQLMIIGIVLVLIVTIGVLYFTYFSEPEIDLTILQPPTATTPTKFNTEVLDDVRTQNLNQFGPEEVTVQNRGRKLDPFAPF